MEAHARLLRLGLPGMAQTVFVSRSNSHGEKRVSENAWHKSAQGQDTGEGKIIFQGF